MSRTIVLDVSAALAWCFEDEATEASTRLLTDLADSAALVPSLFHVELANGLLVAERRKRIDAAEIVQFISLIDELEIRTDHAVGYAGLATLFGLARQSGLTAYDATYLDVALRHQVPIATRDRALCVAARAARVELIEL